MKDRDRLRKDLILTAYRIANHIRALQSLKMRPRPKDAKGVLINQPSKKMVDEFLSVSISHYVSRTKQSK